MATRIYPENRDPVKRAASRKAAYERNKQRWLEKMKIKRQERRTAERKGLDELFWLYTLSKDTLQQMIDSESNTDKRRLLKRILNGDSSSKMFEGVSMV